MRQLWADMGEITKAFILGAGLGTRLRPLTDTLPKPLVPVGNRPLINFAFDHLISDLNIKEFAVNTHHCPDAYTRAFPENSYRGRPILFRYEPVLLDTAGGIDNLRDWLPAEESFIVYNGDILTDLPLERAMEEHLRSGDVVTMLLRSKGDELRVGYDPETGKVVDLRGVLAPDWPHRYQFTGIYLVSPRFLPFLKPGKIESVILPILEAIKAGEEIGGVVVDEGEWSDLGERNAYLGSLALPGRGFPRYGADAFERISPEAVIEDGVVIDSLSTVGPRAHLGRGAVIRESVIWAEAKVSAGASLDRVVVREGEVASGLLQNVDI